MALSASEPSTIWLSTWLPFASWARNSCRRFRNPGRVAVGFVVAAARIGMDENWSDLRVRVADVGWLESHPDGSSSGRTGCWPLSRRRP